MSVRVPRPHPAMERKVHNHPLGHQLAGEVGNQTDTARLRELARDRQDELPRELGILPFFRGLDRIPKPAAVGHPLGGSVRQEDRALADARLPSEVVRKAGPLVHQERAGPVGCRSHRASARGTADDLGFEAVDGHVWLPLGSRGQPRREVDIGSAKHGQCITAPFPLSRGSGVIVTHPWCAGFARHSEPMRKPGLR